MSALYKLTTQDWKTRAGHENEALWGPRVTHTATGCGPLCSEGFLHAYTDPLLAVFMNPVHASIIDPVLWKCTGDVKETDGGLKVGCTSLTTLKIMRLPRVTLVHRVAFAVLCGMTICKDKAFTEWAQRWLSAEDRTSGSSEHLGWTKWQKTTAKSRLIGKRAAKAAFLLSTHWGAMQVAKASAATAVAVAECVHGFDRVDFIGLARRASEVK